MTMHKNRLEAFSDGVFAIIITIMVLELKAPQRADLGALWPLWPVFASYTLSFIYVAIYWNNHHHLFQLVHHVDGGVLWPNTFLLFWLSLVPFVTAWVGSNDFAPIPVALYGVVMFMAAAAYYILGQVLLARHGKDSDLGRALGSDFKGRLSTFLYLVAIIIALWRPFVAIFVYALVAALWFVPDLRVEKVARRYGARRKADKKP